MPALSGNKIRGRKVWKGGNKFPEEFFEWEASPRLLLLLVFETVAEEKGVYKV